MKFYPGSELLYATYALFEFLICLYKFYLASELLYMPFVLYIKFLCVHEIFSRL